MIAQNCVLKLIDLQMLISSLAHKQNGTLHSPVFICTLHVECIIADNSSLIILTLMCYHVNGGFRLLA